jgi:hypothetical protein
LREKEVVFSGDADQPPGEAPQRMVGAQRLPYGFRRALLGFRSRIVIAPKLWRLDLLCAF